MGSKGDGQQGKTSPSFEVEVLEVSGIGRIFLQVPGELLEVGQRADRFERQIVFRSGFAAQRGKGYGGLEGVEGESLVEQVVSDRPVSSRGLGRRVGRTNQVDRNLKSETGSALGSSWSSVPIPKRVSSCRGLSQRAGRTSGWHLEERE